MESNFNIDIAETIRMATREAIREYEKERQKEENKKILHNTKVLLYHYNDLKKHVDKAIDDINQIEDIIYEKNMMDIYDLNKDELYILSIKRSKSKTLIMLAHIDMALQELKIKEKNLCTLEKFEALKKHFIDEKTYETVAEELNCGTVTARRWINEMIDELSILLFGVDGLYRQ